MPRSLLFANISTSSLFWNTVHKHWVFCLTINLLQTYMFSFSQCWHFFHHQLISICEGMSLSTAKGEGEAGCCHLPKPLHSDGRATAHDRIFGSYHPRCVCVKCACTLPTCEWQKDTRQMQLNQVLAYQAHWTPSPEQSPCKNDTIKNTAFSYHSHGI